MGNIVSVVMCYRLNKEHTEIMNEKIYRKKNWNFKRIVILICFLSKKAYPVEMDVIGS